MNVSRVVVLLLSCALMTQQARGDEPRSPIGLKVEDFSLQDYRGTSHRLADYHDSRIVIVAFLGTECPLAKLYTPRLASLFREYQPRGVAFLGINANRQDSITEVTAHARVHEIPFP